MPRTPEQNHLIRDKRQRQILERALWLFAMRGFDQVTIDDITMAADCSHGLFYHYFDGKEAIFNALMGARGQFVEEGAQPLEDVLSGKGADGLKGVCDRCAKTLMMADEAVCFARLGALRRYAASSAVSPLAGTDPFPRIAAMIKEAQADGTAAPGDPETMAEAFFDFFAGAAERRLRVGKEAFKPVPSALFFSFFTK